MPGSWWTKIGLVALAAMLSVLLLIPTVYQKQVPEDPEEWPGWYTQLWDAFGGAHITLGLDLQGGLHLQYQVDVDQAISDKVDQYVDQIRESIQDDHPDASFTVERIEGATAIRVTAEGSNPRDLLDDDLLMLMNLVVQPQGGGTLRLDIDPEFVDQTRTYAVEQAIETIRKRIDAYGVAEPSISRRGDTDIIVQLPGLNESEFDRVKDTIAQTAQLTFQMVSPQSSSFLPSVSLPPTIGETTVSPGSVPIVDDLPALREAYAQVETPAGTEVVFLEQTRVNPDTQQFERQGYSALLVERQTRLTGDYVANARAATDPQTGRPVVSLEFDPQGARIFGDLTTENVDRQMAIILDGVAASAPNINEPILGGRAQITMGGGSYNESLLAAENLVIVLRNGALPAPIEKQFETQVGPSLGADSIRSGALSLAVAFSLVVIFVLFYYRGGGFIANTALLLNVVFILAMLALLRATLTLPGIAGITLTIGMAVDANVIIFERIKEELHLGKQARAAVAAGYEKALSAVLDANITTFIAGVVLLQVGSGPVRGFAVTLLIGILSSLFTALFVTRLLFDYLLDGRKVTRLSI